MGKDLGGIRETPQEPSSVEARGQEAMPVPLKWISREEAERMWPSASAIEGEIIEQDEFAKYERIVKAKSGSFPHEGYRWWKRAKLANKRADAAESLAAELKSKADAYDACVSVATKRISWITPEFERELPRRCQISQEQWKRHKDAPILGVDMVEYAKLKAKDEQIEALKEALLNAMALIEGANGIEIRRDQSWHIYREGMAAALDCSGRNLADAHSNPPSQQRDRT